MKTNTLAASLATLLAGTICAAQAGTISTVSPLNTTKLKSTSEFSTLKEKRQTVMPFQIDTKSLQGSKTSTEFRRLSDVNSGLVQKKNGTLDAGGNGMVVNSQNGKLQSISEAGIVWAKSMAQTSKDYDEYCDLSYELREEIKTVINQLPLEGSNQFFAELVIGDRDKCIRISNISSETYGQIKQDYGRLLKTLGYDIKKMDFQVPAFSSLGRTYIISKYFDDQSHMSLRQQALTMIHEYFIRQNFSVYDGRYWLSVPEIVSRALQVDAQILRILKNEPNVDSLQSVFDFQMALNLAAPAVLPSKALIKNRLLMAQSSGQPLLLSHLLLKPVNTYFLTKNEGVKISPALVKMHLEKRAPGITYLIENFNTEIGFALVKLNGIFSDLADNVSHSVVGTVDELKYKQLCEQWGVLLKQSSVAESDALIDVRVESDDIKESICVLRAIRCEVENGFYRPSYRRLRLK